MKENTGLLILLSGALAGLALSVMMAQVIDGVMLDLLAASKNCAKDFGFR